MGTQSASFLQSAIKRRGQSRGRRHRHRHRCRFADPDRDGRVRRDPDRAQCDLAGGTEGQHAASVGAVPLGQPRAGRGPGSGAGPLAGVERTVIAGLQTKLNQVMPFPAAADRAANFVLSFILLSAVIAAVYKVLPDCDLDWRDVAAGAMVTALLITVGKVAIGILYRQQRHDLRLWRRRLRHRRPLLDLLLCPNLPARRRIHPYLCERRMQRSGVYLPDQLRPAIQDRQHLIRFRGRQADAGAHHARSR